jgi:hypothetical protein
MSDIKITDDAELFALIAEYRRVERDDPEKIAQVFAKIAQIRPVTVHGVSAVLDLYCEDWFELGWQPDKALAALREIAAREARS